MSVREAARSKALEAWLTLTEKPTRANAVAAYEAIELLADVEGIEHDQARTIVLGMYRDSNPGKP